MRRIVIIGCILCGSASWAADTPKSGTAPEAPAPQRSYTSIAAAMADTPIPVPPIPKEWNDATRIKFDAWNAAANAAFTGRTKGAKLTSTATVNSFTIPKVLATGNRLIDSDKMVVRLTVPIGASSFKGLPFYEKTVDYQVSLDRKGPVAGVLGTLRLPAKCGLSAQIAKLGLSYTTTIAGNPREWKVYVKLEDEVELSNFIEAPAPPKDKKDH